MKKLVYMVVDTETATLPFANEIAQGNAELKKKIAIAKPLVYDIGWTLMYRNGEVFEKKQFLITETFSVPAVFNTAYYASKRPLYLAMMERGEIECLPWAKVMEVFVADLARCDFVGAFNSMFDFKKALPFTELYISKLYSPTYFEWEQFQRNACEKILRAPYQKKEKDFDPEHFIFRGESYDMFDVWGMACDRLLNKKAYKEMCLDGAMLTNSGDYFKTSAETAFRYLREQYDFEEAHTALADAEIESFILSKILAKGKIDIGIDYFPFRKLGHPLDYVQEMKKSEKRDRYASAIYNQMYNYLGLDTEDGVETFTPYQQKTLAKMAVLRDLMGES